MLVTLIPNENKVKEYSEHINRCKVLYPECDFTDVNKLEDKYTPYSQYLETIKDYHSIEADDRDTFEGVYVCDLNSEHALEHLTDMKQVTNFDSPLYFRSYGVSDNASQVLDYYESLCNEYSSYTQDRKFIILMTPIFKEDQPRWGGWRWHKWGKYVGKFVHEHEYLYDEVGIDYVYVFNILEVEECGSNGTNSLSEMLKYKGAAFID